jgi:hypothetical protein
LSFTVSDLFLFHTAITGHTLITHFIFLAKMYIIIIHVMQARMKLLHTQTTYFFYSCFCHRSYDAVLKFGKWYERSEEHTGSIIGVEPTTSQHAINILHSCYRAS